MRLRAYYERCAALQDQYDGKRVRLCSHPDNWVEMVGTTGRLRASEDCLTMRLDGPPLSWFRDFEDAQAGELVFDSDDRFEVVAEDYPVHSGQAKHGWKA